MLSDEQRDTIEDSVWVVNTVLKKQGLENDEDMRQSALLYMCKCIQRFDPSKNIKWTTFAYKNIYLFVKRNFKKQQEKSIPTVSENMFYLADKEDDIEIYDFDDPKGVLEAFKGICTPDPSPMILPFEITWKSRSFPVVLDI